MASLVKAFYGAWAGPGPSYFRVVAEVWDYGDTGTGHNIRLRRWVQVNDEGNFNGTLVSTAWAGYVYLYGPGTYYNLTETEDYHIKYGETFGTDFAYIYANYTGSAYYDSRTSVAYTVPEPTYTVSYDANGGTGAPSAQTKTYGTNLTLSKTVPTRTGYTFKNWNTKKDGSGTNYASGGTYTANVAVTLYAQWTINTYTVSYNANGGSGAPGSQTKTYGVSLTLSDTKPTRTGYRFKNWNTKSDGSGTSYASGGTYTTNAAVTLYAQWTINTYAVVYDANGGSGAPASDTKTYNVSLTLSKTIPTRSGYGFLGWSASKTAVTPEYLAGGTYTKNASITLYAVWKRKGRMYLVYDAQVRKGRACLYQEGEKRVGIPWMKVNGVWKKGGA